MNLNKDEWQIGFDDGSGKGRDGEGIFIRAYRGFSSATIINGGRDDWGIPVGIIDPAVANVIVTLPQMYRAFKALLGTAQHERKTGLCQGSEWATVVGNAETILAEIDRNMTE